MRLCGGVCTGDLSYYQLYALPTIFTCLDCIDGGHIGGTLQYIRTCSTCISKYIHTYSHDTRTIKHWVHHSTDTKYRTLQGLPIQEEIQLHMVITDPLREEGR